LFPGNLQYFGGLMETNSDHYGLGS